MLLILPTSRGDRRWCSDYHQIPILVCGDIPFHVLLECDLLLCVGAQFIDDALNRAALGLGQEPVHEEPSADAAQRDEHEGDHLALGGGRHQEEHLRDGVVGDPVHCGSEAVANAAEVQGVDLGVDGPGDGTQTDREKDQVEQDARETQPFSGAYTQV